MFRDLRQSGGSRKKRSPTKKQLAALAKGRAVRMRNIRKNKKTKIQRGGGMCPEGTVPFNNRLHCCRHDTDINGAPIDIASTSCKDSNYITCENEVDNTLSNEICYEYLSDVDKNLVALEHHQHEESPPNGFGQNYIVAPRPRPSLAVRQLTKEEKAYIANVVFHYGKKAAGLSILDVIDWNKVRQGLEGRVIRDHISGEDISISGPPNPVPESPFVLAKFGRMPDWAYPQPSAVPVAEQVEGANDAGGSGAGMADVAAPPLPPAAATGAAEDDDSSSSSEDDEA